MGLHKGWAAGRRDGRKEGRKDGTPVVSPESDDARRATPWRRVVDVGWGGGLGGRALLPAPSLLLFLLLLFLLFLVFLMW